MLPRSLLLMGMACALSATVADAAEGLKPAELEKIIQASADAYCAAHDAGDADKLASLFTPEAEYVDNEGVVFHGRDAIRAEHAATFAVSPKGKLMIEVTAIRPIAANVIVEEGVTRFEPVDGGQNTGVRYTATHIKQGDGKWLLGSVRVLDDLPPTPHERLQSMAWLLGRWRDESHHAIVHSEWKWSEDGNFLLGEFAVQFQGQPPVKGTHRIGWDPQRQQFRSWIFEADGSFGTGWWTDVNGVWNVSMTTITAEGDSEGGVLSYERDGRDALIVTQRDRYSAGEALESVEVRVVRAPPGPAE